ncbi:hypothetical protein H632_c4080p0, partial [Helicosporidium sp. ATCC 50920]
EGASRGAAGRQRQPGRSSRFGAGVCERRAAGCSDSTRGAAGRSGGSRSRDGPHRRARGGGGGAASFKGPPRRAGGPDARAVGESGRPGGGFKRRIAAARGGEGRGPVQSSRNGSLSAGGATGGGRAPPRERGSSVSGGRGGQQVPSPCCAGVPGPHAGGHAAHGAEHRTHARGPGFDGGLPSRGHPGAGSCRAGGRGAAGQAGAPGRRRGASELSRAFVHAGGARLHLCALAIRPARERDSVPHRQPSDARAPRLAGGALAALLPPP